MSEENYNFNIYTIVPPLLKNDTFYAFLRGAFPEILSELVTLRSNPNCSCKKKALAVIHASYTNNRRPFDDFFNKNPEIKKLALNVQNEHYLGGRIFRIKKGQEEWKKFFNSINGNYRSFSINPVNDEYIDIYFL